MTDTADAEASPELVPPTPASEPAAPPQAAVAEVEPLLEERSPLATIAHEAAALAAEASGAPEDREQRSLPFDVEHLGLLRRAIIDHLVDTDEPQSVAQILAALPPGTSRNTCESALKRNFDAGLIERVAPGTYRLAPPKPARLPTAAPPPEPDPVRSDDQTAEDQARLVDRERKREARRRDAEAAAARQRAADAELRVKLIEAAGGNVQHGSGVDDVGAIRRALELGVPITDILLAVRCTHNPQSCPTNGAAITWRSPALLKKIAELHCKFTIIPSMIAAMAASKAPGKAADTSEASSAVQAPPETADAPAVSQANGIDPSGDDAAELGSDAAALLQRFGRPDVQAASPSEPAPVAQAPIAVGREAVLAAFSRPREPSPTLATTPLPEKAPSQSQPRPWFAPGAPQPESGMTDDSWRFILEGYRAGNVVWAGKHGPPPGTAGCKVPGRILKEFGL